MRSADAPPLLHLPSLSATTCRAWQLQRDAALRVLYAGLVGGLDREGECWRGSGGGFAVEFEAASSEECRDRGRAEVLCCSSTLYTDTCTERPKNEAEVSESYLPLAGSMRPMQLHQPHQLLLVLLAPAPCNTEHAVRPRKTKCIAHTVGRAWCRS